MSEDIFTGISPNLKRDQYLNTKRLDRASEELAANSELLRAGDETVDFELAASLDFEKAKEQAMMRSVQSRASWYQTSTQYLESIQSTLTQMSAISLKASSFPIPPAERDSLNAEFLQLKESLSIIIDGFGGRSAPEATFNQVPLFLSQAPDVVIGADSLGSKEKFEPLNLYTGYGQEGFSSIPLITTASQSTTTPTLTGTALAGTASSATLDFNAAAIDEIYASLTLEVTGGTGNGQMATIASYDAKTRVATFTAPLGTGLDNTSQYKIYSAQDNLELTGSATVSSVRFAEHIWGADNDRLDRLTEDQATFRALTQQERDYRTANSIPNTDLEPKTYEEKMERRQHNLFDLEFGTLENVENAKRMKQQVDRASDQITILMTREQAKGAHLVNQYTYGQELVTAHEEGIGDIAGLDVAEALSLHAKLMADSDKILRLAAQMSRSVGSLNRLLQK